MAEVLLQFAEVLRTSEGKTYVARVCGRQADDGRWEGWLEFLPDDGSAVLRSTRETIQPNREALRYWATGLTEVYLEGALARTLEPWRPPAVPPPGTPVYDGPAPEPRRVPAAAVPEPAGAIIDPFSVYAKGEELLRKELGALSSWHLRNVLRAHALTAASDAELERMGHAELVERIVLGVRERRAQAVEA